MAALLAIDPAGCTGVAFARDDRTIHHRTWRLEGTGGGRLVEFDRLLTALHAVERFARIGYEQPFFSLRFPTAAEPLIELTGHIKFWAASHGLPYAAYTPPEIKRAVARGNASKATMIERVRWLGFNPANDHEADAIALLRLMQFDIPPAAPARKAAAKAARRQAAAVDLFRHAARAG